MHITGLYKHWDNKVQRFVDKSRESEEKNKLLQREKLNYLKVADRRETEGKDWLPVELSHFYEQKSKRRNQYLSVSEMIDILYERFMKQERYKNGKIHIEHTKRQTPVVFEAFFGTFHSVQISAMFFQIYVPGYYGTVSSGLCAV